MHTDETEHVPPPPCTRRPQLVYFAQCVIFCIFLELKTHDRRPQTKHLYCNRLLSSREAYVAEQQTARQFTL